AAFDGRSLLRGRVADLSRGSARRLCAADSSHRAGHGIARQLRRLADLRPAAPRPATAVDRAAHCHGGAELDPDRHLGRSGLEGRAVYAALTAAPPGGGASPQAPILSISYGVVW